MNWILPSDRLPTTDGDVLVTEKVELWSDDFPAHVTGVEFVAALGYFDTWNRRWHDSETHEEVEIVAWQPLPAPAVPTYVPAW